MTTCEAQTGPIWKLGGEPCGCTVPASAPHVTHRCSCGTWWDDSCRRYPTPFEEAR